jgi:hypothetical protein
MRGLSSVPLNAGTLLEFGCNNFPFLPVKSASKRDGMPAVTLH